MEDDIRDQLVSSMREELHNCPDGVAYCVEPPLGEVEVEWGPEIPDGLRIKTDRGIFAVKVSVIKIDD